MKSPKNAKKGPVQSSGYGQQRPGSKPGATIENKNVKNMQSLQHFRQANKQSKVSSESAQQQKVFPAGNSNLDIDETEKNSVSTQPATT